ncbi:myb-binding protein 1A [Python bivittatus]|uniref:Myb-binding protein 1A n=1 Tax=Python bivittatus TaxID=176946 RepID=A0A9F5IQL3_PYTBI|nr:myb-binding protein 1A [Python bivittatus]
MAGECNPKSGPAAGRLASASASHPGRLLGQNRQFLDFFWDIAKPDQAIRLKATEGLLSYLQESKKDDEFLKYTLKRLIDGLGATREVARPGFSLALAQVLQVFEELTLLAVLQQIREKYDLGRVKKKLFRNALFGNFFGVLALFQSKRLAKDSKALLECVQLLQSLSEHHVHLKDLPRKTLADIVSEIPEAVFEKVLYSILEDELTAAFSTPGQLYLLLVGIQKFPKVLRPEKLKDLLGTTVVVTAQNIPRIVEVLKMAAKSERKEKVLPAVGLDLMKVALKEETFELFWKEAVENGLLKENVGPCSYMCFRLLGSILPFLSLSQLKTVLQGEVMRQYGFHVVTSKLPDRFKFAPEMEAYVDSFLEGCDSPEKQLAAMIAFSTLTNQGYPVVPTFWKVVRHLLPAALQKYIDWLKDMFLSPNLDCCVDFATKRQKEKRTSSVTEHSIARLRKWIIGRLVGIAEHPQINKEDELVMDIARFCFFHAFFEAKKPFPKITETKVFPAVPLNEVSRTVAADSFFSLLQHLNTMPALGDSAEAEEMRKKHLHGLTASGEPWIHCVVQYASVLLSHQEQVKMVAPFNDEEQQAWDKMLQTVEALKKRDKKSQSTKTSAFQHLLLLVGIHLFKSPAECVNLLNDLQSCIKRAFGEKLKKKKAVATDGEEEPAWVEVIVEVLLSLLTQSSGLIRRVCKNVFGLVCQHMTKGALQLILDVLDPQEDQDEESAVVVMEETEKRKKLTQKDTKQDEESGESSDEDSSEESDESDKEGWETNSEGEGEPDENFRAMLRNVLQAGNAVEGDDSDEDVDDETMMSLDENLSSLFAEQQKRIQAKKDEKEKLRKEKTLRRDFKIKVLDLVELFLTKQAGNPLVFSVIDPLLSVIEHSMNSDSNKQEQDYLRKTADIFTNSLCRSKQYCKNVSSIQEELHTQLESLVNRGCKQSDSSVALYYFSGSLYLFRVLRGNAPADEMVSEGAQTKKKWKNPEGSEVSPGQHFDLGSVDLDRVTAVYKEALNLFLTKRKSPLTGAMFLDLFERHPMMCKQLIDVVVKSITEGARQHQQTQACLLLQKALQNKCFKLSLSEKEWEDLIRESTHQITKTLKNVNEFKVKVDREKVIKCLELLSCLIKIVTQQELSVDLTELRGVLQTLGLQEHFEKSIRLDNVYWNVMKLLGFKRPVKEKVSAQPANGTVMQSLKRKKKGFLPATKKRQNRKKVQPGQSQENGAEGRRRIPAPGEAKVPSEGKKKRKRRRKRAAEEGKRETSEQGPPAKRGAPSPGIAKGAAGPRGRLKKKKQQQRKERKKGGKKSGTA